MSQDISSSAFADAPLTLRESAAYLKCSQRTIQRLVQRKQINVHYLGDSPRFLRADLLAALKSSP
jgi:excisionase family DNA binding protein